MNKVSIKDPYGFIYITTNLTNGKKYIGQKIFDLRGEWKSYLGSGRLLIDDISVYGRQKFSRDIVDVAFSENELHKKEKIWINNLNAVKSEDYYNLASGGEWGVHLSGENNPMFGRTWWDENTPKNKIDEWKHSVARKGKNNGMFGVSPKERMSEEVYNKWLKKQRENKIGSKNPNYGNKKLKEYYDKNPEQKIKLARKGSQNGRAISVVCTSTNECFQYLREATTKYNLKSTTQITNCCKGSRDSYGVHNGIPLKWMYLDEYIQRYGYTDISQMQKIVNQRVD